MMRDGFVLSALAGFVASLPPDPFAAAVFPLAAPPVPVHAASAVAASRRTMRMKPGRCIKTVRCLANCGGLGNRKGSRVNCAGIVKRTLLSAVLHGAER